MTCFIFCKMAFIQDTISVLSGIWYIILTTWFQHPNHLTNLTTLTIQPNNQISCPNQPNFPDHLSTQNILTEQWPTCLPWVKHNSDNRDHPNHSNHRSMRATFSTSRRDWEFLQFNLAHWDETRLFWHLILGFDKRSRKSLLQSRASRRDLDLLSSFSGFKTRMRVLSC